MPAQILRSRRLCVLFAAAFALSSSPAAGIDTDAARAKVLGASDPVKASCPAKCVVEARVTGFQLAIGRNKKPFRVPAHGRIVAWSVTLGTPAKADIRAFNERFGPSQARISILKPVRVKRGRRAPKLRYRLRRQSPLQELQPFFGETTTFGLQEPLKVRKGNIVALTMPTWAPAFAVGQSGRWRASRAPTKDRGPCSLRGGLANLRAGGPHDRVGSLRRYGCAYRGARLLYSTRFLRAKSGR